MSMVLLPDFYGTRPAKWLGDLNSQRPPDGGFWRSALWPRNFVPFVAVCDFSLVATF